MKYAEKSGHLTNTTGKCYPSEALIVLNCSENKAMADQIATGDILRFTKKASELNSKDMKQIEHVIKMRENQTIQKFLWTI